MELAIIDSYNILKILITLVLGLYLKFIFSFFNQNWASSKTQDIVFMLLPVITFIITKVIASNLALSLGMIGALSIVRFRNPVKSPSELVTYFLLITIGISAATAFSYALLLIIITTFVLIFINFIHKIKYFDRFYLYSFSEHDESKMITLIFNSRKNELHELIELKNYIYNKDLKTHTYKIISNDIKFLKSLDFKYKDECIETEIQS